MGGYFVFFAIVVSTLAQANQSFSSGSFDSAFLAAWESRNSDLNASLQMASKNSTTLAFSEAVLKSLLDQALVADVLTGVPLLPKTMAIASLGVSAEVVERIAELSAQKATQKTPPNLGDLQTLLEQNSDAIPTSDKSALTAALMLMLELRGRPKTDKTTSVDSALSLTNKVLTVLNSVAPGSTVALSDVSARLLGAPTGSLKPLQIKELLKKLEAGKVRPDSVQSVLNDAVNASVVDPERLDLSLGPARDSLYGAVRRSAGRNWNVPDSVAQAEQPIAGNQSPISTPQPFPSLDLPGLGSSGGSGSGTNARDSAHLGSVVGMPGSGPWPGAFPGMFPGLYPGMYPGMYPGGFPGMGPGFASYGGSGNGFADGSRRGITRPGSGSGSTEVVPSAPNTVNNSDLLQACVAHVRQNPVNVPIVLPGALCASAPIAEDPVEAHNQILARADSDACTIPLGTATHCTSGTVARGSSIQLVVDGKRVRASITNVGRVADGNKAFAGSGADLSLMTVSLPCSQAKKLNFARVPTLGEIQTLKQRSTPLVLQQNHMINADIRGRNQATIAGEGRWGGHFIQFNTASSLNSRGSGDSSRIRSGDSGGAGLTCQARPDGKSLDTLYLGAISYIVVTGGANEGQIGGVASGRSLEGLSALFHSSSSQGADQLARRTSGAGRQLASIETSSESQHGAWQ